jgi:hypothetical protein
MDMNIYGIHQHRTIFNRYIYIFFFKKKQIEMIY